MCDDRFYMFSPCYCYYFFSIFSQEIRITKQNHKHFDQCIYTSSIFFPTFVLFYNFFCIDWFGLFWVVAYRYNLLLLCKWLKKYFFPHFFRPFDASYQAMFDHLFVSSVFFTHFIIFFCSSWNMIALDRTWYSSYHMVTICRTWI